MSEPSIAPAGRDWRRTGVVLGLGTTQTLAWASSYYLIAFIAGPQAADVGTSTSMIFAAFTGALLVSALLGPRVGRTIDLFGGREVLAVSNLMFAAGLMVMALAEPVPVMWLGWLLMGAGMGLGLYDAAFAALGRIYGENARGPITGITLLAGFASTVGWPLTAWGVDAFRPAWDGLPRTCFWACRSICWFCRAWFAQRPARLPQRHPMW
jgi:MFS family permease